MPAFMMRILCCRIRAGTPVVGGLLSTFRLN
jgi:hypothetical protein